MTTQVKPTSMHSRTLPKGRAATLATQGWCECSGSIRMTRTRVGRLLVRSRNTGFQLMLPLPVLSDFAARTNAPPHSLEPRQEID
jgi:hypothetical protein